MTTEEKFRAAVNVIRSLPKNGSYQPSPDLMLRFYAYYKQATEGPCKSTRPGFWEMIKKAKWDAWNRLGNMSREEAMESYVEELKKIVETMSYTENVAQFLESLDSFYERVPQEDLNLLVGNIVERVVGGSGESSPLRPSSPNHSPAAAALVSRFGSSLETSPASSCCSPSPQPPGSSSDQETEDDEDEFIDTIEEGASPSVNANGPHGIDGSKRSIAHSPTRTLYKQHLTENGLDANHNHRDIISNQIPQQNHAMQDERGEKYLCNGKGDGISKTTVISGGILKKKSIPNGDVRKLYVDNKSVPAGGISDLVGGRTDDSAKNGLTEQNSTTNGLVYNEENVNVPADGTPEHVLVEDQTTSLHIKQLVLDLQSDLDLIRSRLRSLEKSSITKGHPRGTDSIVHSYPNNSPKWWPFPELSPRTTAFLVLWPFAAHLIVSYLTQHRRSRP